MVRKLLLLVLAAVFATTASPVYDGQTPFETTQGESISPAIDKIGDNTTHWTQNDRDFIHRDGLTCKSSKQLKL
jgi:hypothetical protein